MPLTNIFSVYRPAKIVLLRLHYFKIEFMPIETGNETLWDTISLFINNTFFRNNNIWLNLLNFAQITIVYSSCVFLKYIIPCGVLAHGCIYYCSISYINLLLLRI